MRYPLEKILKLRKLSQLSLAIIAALTTTVNAQEAKTTAKQGAFEKIEVTARKRDFLKSIKKQTHTQLTLTVVTT